MAAKRYVALLRAINVGGRNRVPMTDLRAAFEADGHRAVKTHLQSGNVIFETDAPRDALEDDLETLLERTFGFAVPVVVRSHAQMRNVVTKAPPGFGARPEELHSDARFPKAPLTAKRVMGMVQLREGVDQAWPGSGVVYFARLSEQRTKSRMGSIVGTPEYKQMTIRSWKTTTKLLDLLEPDR